MSASVVVLGGGLSGLAAAYTLADAGLTDITVIERGAAVGGLAGSFEHDGQHYPIGYHHILHHDHPLHFFLDRIGVLPGVRWRRIRMAFWIGGRLHEPGRPLGFVRFPMPVADKLRFARLMLRAFRKRDWSEWQGRSAEELVDAWAGAGVRKALFEPLCRLKYELPCREVSGAWLGARLYYREGSAPFGYVPGTNWTTLLCHGLARLTERQGVRTRVATSVNKLRTEGKRIVGAELSNGEVINGDWFVSTIPTETYLALVDRDETAHLAEIRYSALLSVVCATRQRVPPLYWTNMTSPGATAAAIFLPSALNPTICRPGEVCVNFVTHLNSRSRPLFTAPDEELMAAYLRDFRAVFGFPLEPFWFHVFRVPMYSPVFTRGFFNPPAHSGTWANLYFGGNYRTFPSIASTGTALRSGIETAATMLADMGRSTALPAAVSEFRLPAMPRE